MNVQEQIDRLREYDESLSQGIPPGDGWWLVYEDLNKAADTLEKLNAVRLALKACGKISCDNLPALQDLSEAIAAVEE